MTTDFPTRDEDIRALRGTLLRELAAATYPKEAVGLIARNHGLTVEDVRALVVDYGYPEIKEMRRHLFELGISTPPPAAPAPPAPRPAPTADSTNVVERLLAEGRKSQRARTKNLAGKIDTLLGDLRELVLAERKERESAKEAAAEHARLKAEVDALEAQLAQKKAALKPIGTKKARSPKRTNTKEIRDWAAKHSVACPDRGRLPNDVIEAYELANRGAA